MLSVPLHNSVGYPHNPSPSYTRDGLRLVGNRYRIQGPGIAGKLRGLCSALERRVDWLFRVSIGSTREKMDRCNEGLNLRFQLVALVD